MNDSSKYSKNLYLKIYNKLQLILLIIFYQLITIYPKILDYSHFTFKFNFTKRWKTN